MVRHLPVRADRRAPALVSRSAPVRQPTTPPTWLVHVHELQADGTERTRLEVYEERKGKRVLISDGSTP